MAEPVEATALLASPEESLLPGKNLVWCESFQQAWNLFGKEVCGEAPKLLGDPEVASALSRSFGGKPSIDPESLFLRAGEITPSFIEEINLSLKKKFEGNAPAPLGLGAEQGFLVYAFLFKDLRFPIPFDRQTNGLSFVDSKGSLSKVETFGIPEVNGSVDPKLVTQIKVLGDTPGEYVVELKTSSKQDRLILAMTKPGPLSGTDNKRRTPPMDTLQKVITSTLAQIKKGASPVTPQNSDHILVPRISLDTTQIFSDLIGREILNARVKGSKIRDARMSLRFSLDAGGASTSSDARILSVKNGHIARRIVFDRPFLLLMLNAASNKAYLAMLIQNPEILVPMKTSVKDR